MFVSDAKALTISSPGNPEIFSESDSKILIKTGDEFRVDFIADVSASWQMSFSLNGGADVTGTEKTNPYITVTSDNSASVIGRLQSGDVKIKVSAFDGAGNSDSAEFTVTTVNSHGITGDNTVTPDMDSISAVELTDELRQKIANYYKVSTSEIYSLYLESGVTIDSSTRKLTQEDYDTLSEYSARTLYALPKMTVNKSGVYVWINSVKGYASTGANLQELFNIASKYTCFKSDGNNIDFDEETKYFLNPEDQCFIEAALMTAGETYWGYVVVPADGAEELPVTVIEPVPELSFDVLQNIANEMSIDVSELNLLTADNLSAPREATKAMRDAAAKDRYQLAYKLDTITVSEDGYYVFAVNVPEEFRGKSLNSMKFYTFAPDFSGSSVNSSIWGLLNGIGTLGEFNMMGFNINSLEGKILVVGLFQAAEPVCVFLARLLLTLLLGGCNATGAGIVLCSVSSAALLVYIRKRRK